MSRVLRAAPLALAVVLALPGVAHAAVALASEVPATAAGSQQFAFTTNKPYWSVVALLPPFGQDHDLAVTGVAGNANSLYGGSHIDFIAIDGNRAPKGRHTAIVNPYGAATGTYTVEFADSGLPMPFPNSSQTFDNGRIVRVYDAYLTAGRYYGLRSGLAGDIFIMASEPGVPATYVRSRAQAAARTNVSVGGSVCSTYRAPRSAWYGIVVITGWQGGLPQTRQKGTLKPEVSLTDPDWVNCVRY